MKIIAIANQKGGVGKTTTAVNMAAGLVQKGYAVLCIDFDPQGNLSNYLGWEPDGKPTVSDLMTAAAQNNMDTVPESIRTSGEGVDYIPSDIALASADLFLSSVMCREQVLKRILSQPGLRHYDYIVVDCLPSLGILLTNALTAADSLIIPVQAQKFALDGLGQLESVYTMVKENLNPNLEIAGVLLTMVDNTNMSRAVEDALAASYGDKLFTSRIHKSVEASNSTYEQRSLVSKTSSRLGCEYRDMVDEYIERG